MAAQATTIDRFEARTYEALAGVTRVRHAFRNAGVHGQLVVIEGITSFLLHRLLAPTTSQWLAALSHEQAEVAVRGLSELHEKLGQLLQLGEKRAATRAWFHAWFFRDAARAQQRVGELLESLYLGMNDDFRQLVDDCRAHLKGRSGTRRDWRSSLAGMRD
jgi:hypothetical protein